MYKKETMANNQVSYASVIDGCVTEFIEKNKKYGQSWTEDRIFTLAQQVLIKLNRIKTIQEKNGLQKVDDPLEKEFPGIFNYCMLAKVRIKWEKEHFVFERNVAHEKVVAEFSAAVNHTKELYAAKNHDYGEVWRILLISTMVDFMLNKYRRLEEIYLNSTTEEVKFDDYDEIFKDIANYAVFCMANIAGGMNPLR